MGTFKTTVSGLAETQMSSMGSNPSPAPASNLRLTGSGRLNALLERHHLRCVWVIKRPFSSSISKQKPDPRPHLQVKEAQLSEGITPPNELSPCPEPVASQMKLASQRADFKSQYQVPLFWALSMTQGRNVWKQGWGSVSTAIQLSVYSWPSLTTAHQLWHQDSLPNNSQHIPPFVFEGRRFWIHKKQFLSNSR